MINLLDHIYQNNEKLIEKLDWKRAIPSIAAAGLIGGAAYTSLLPKRTDIQTSPSSSAAPPNISQPMDKVDSNSKIKQLYKGEYDIIKKAADRNNCIKDDFIILLAIRKAENGPPGLEFGIMHPRAKNTNLDTQAGWAAATIVKNRVRWEKAGKKEDYITFLGRRYCPVGAENDPSGLNRNWIRNVNHWVNKLSKYNVR